MTSVNYGDRVVKMLSLGMSIISPTNDFKVSKLSVKVLWYRNIIFSYTISRRFLLFVITHVSMVFAVGVYIHQMIFKLSFASLTELSALLCEYASSKRFFFKHIQFHSVLYLRHIAYLTVLLLFGSDMKTVIVKIVDER